jgi:hypothetical protein
MQLVCFHTNMAKAENIEAGVKQAAPALLP